MDLVWFAILALMFRVGGAVYACGLSRSKNAAGAVARALVEVAVVTLVIWALGASIAAQTANALFGFDRGLLVGWSSDFGGDELMLVAAALAGALVAGGAAQERLKLGATAITAAAVALVVPIAWQWMQYGWLKRMGYDDTAFATATLLPGAVFGLLLSRLIGPRSGKFNRDLSVNMIPGHSVPLAGAGVLLMLVGWIALVCGLHLGLGSAAGAVMLGAASGGGAAMLYARLRFSRPDLQLALCGLLGGAVAAGVVAELRSPVAVLTGALAGVLVPWTVVHLETALRIDDPAGTVGTFGAASALGGVIMLLAQVFGGHWQAAVAQALGLLAICILATAAALGIAVVLKRLGWTRVSDADEYDGLDLAELDLNAYPDFQQTMIKSYHLREA